MLRMEAGKTYRLTVRNLSNDPTNIHTHGLHVVGTGNGDDVTRIVPPDTCADYVYELPIDHPGGTYWYHPHAQVYSERQMNGGAAGLLIVEDNNNLNNADIVGGNDVISILPDWTKNELLLQIMRLE